MPQKTIAQITQDNSPTSDDEVAVWDYASNSTKRVSLAKLKSEIMQSNPYKFHVYRNAAQSATNGTAKVNFDAEVFDTNNNFDPATNFQYTVPVSGFYLFTWNVTANAGTTSIWCSQLYKNGAALKYGSYGGSGTTGAVSAGSAFVQLTAGDTIAVYHQASGANAFQVGSQVGTSLAGSLLWLT